MLTHMERISIHPIKVNGQISYDDQDINYLCRKFKNVIQFNPYNKSEEVSIYKGKKEIVKKLFSDNSFKITTGNHIHHHRLYITHDIIYNFTNDTLDVEIWCSIHDDSAIAIWIGNCQKGWRIYSINRGELIYLHSRKMVKNKDGSETMVCSDVITGLDLQKLYRTAKMKG